MAVRVLKCEMNKHCGERIESFTLWKFAQSLETMEHLSCNAPSEMLAKHLHCTVGRLRGLSVECPVHTDFPTHFHFLHFQGKFVRTNLICFFPLTTKGATSFYKMLLSLLPNMFYDCNNCKI